MANMWDSIWKTIEGNNGGVTGGDWGKSSSSTNSAVWKGWGNSSSSVSSANFGKTSRQPVRVPTSTSRVSTQRDPSSSTSVTNTATTTNTQSQEQNPFQRQAARDLARDILSNYGFSSSQMNGILGAYEGWLNKGVDSQTAFSLVQTTQEFQSRFKGNSARREAGLSVLSPAEYLQQEDYYSRVFRSYGLSDMATRDNFAYWIGKNISVDEINSRLSSVAKEVQNVDPNFRSVLSKDLGLNTSDLMRWALNDKNTVEQIQSYINVVKIGAEAERANLNLSRGYREELNSAGVSQEQARKAFQNVAETKGNIAKLAQMDGTKITTRNITDASLGLDGEENKRINRLYSNEASRFSGRNAGMASLSKNTSGLV